MNLTTDQLAELLAGVARSQNTIIDAVERANGGWRNNHLLPLLSIAANMRSGEPRLLDLPSRVLLRLQGRAAIDTSTIKADLERLLGQGEVRAAGERQPPASELDFSKKPG
jgi:hypothetical protein